MKLVMTLIVLSVLIAIAAVAPKEYGPYVLLFEFCAILCLIFLNIIKRVAKTVLILIAVYYIGVSILLN
jgi:hypothetical protein